MLLLTPTVSHRADPGVSGPGWSVQTDAAFRTSHATPVLLHCPTRFVHWALVVHAIVVSKLHEPLSGVQLAGVAHAAPLLALLEQTFPLSQSLLTVQLGVGLPAVHLPGTAPHWVAALASVQVLALFEHTPVASAHCAVLPTAVQLAPTLPVVHDPAFAHAGSVSCRGARGRA